tara:strand:+ start:199 stop:597 length:399 start_codon:yes stop_codon:yes gene_type:complete
LNQQISNYQITQNTIYQTTQNTTKTMTKQIIIELSDKDYSSLTRIAKSDKRKTKDLIYLLIAEGLRFFFNDNYRLIEKIESEYTEKEKQQLLINKGKDKTKKMYVQKYIDREDSEKFIDELIESIEKTTWGD